MTNLTIQTTSKGLTAMSINFGFEISEAYIELVFNQLTSENLTNEDFNKACNVIIKTEVCLYGKMPTVAMFLQYAREFKEVVSPEELKNIEYARAKTNLAKKLGTNPDRLTQNELKQITL